MGRDQIHTLMEVGAKLEEPASFGNLFMASARDGIPSHFLITTKRFSDSKIEMLST